MEIDVFYQNDDLSFGFDGMSKLDKDAYAFSKKAQYGFTDVDCSYADGNPSPSWGGRQQEAYRGVFEGWKPSFKTNCEKVFEYINKAKSRIKRDEDDKLTANADRKRVLSDYIQGANFALGELESYYSKAKCEMQKTQKEEADLQSQLGSITSSTTGKVVLIGSVVLLVGVVGFLVYRRLN